MKQIILSITAIALLVNCTNTKSVTTPNPETDNEVKQAEHSPPVFQNDVVDLVPNLDSTIGYDSLNIIGVPIVWVDSFTTIIPPGGGGWGEWPPYEPWPIEISPWIIDWGAIVWYLPDTLEEHQVIQKNHFTSGANCYSITPNETGALFQMEVIEEELVNLGLKQFGDCTSHLPLNLSWANTPIQMRKGIKSIQLNYPKHYELDLQVDFEGELGRQSIQIIS